MARKSRKFLEPEIQVNQVITYDTWIYGRISKESDKAGDSIENQIAISKEYISGKSDLVFRGVFSDLGFSGTNFDRPDYEKMLSGIKNGKVQCVVVKDLSRLGRTYIEVGELLFDIFPMYGVRFISVNDHYDSFDEGASRQKLMILFKNLVNHMYSKDLGKKIRTSFTTKQQNGELLGSKAPYGYIFATNGKKKYLEIEPEAAKIVKLIFDLRLQGLSTIKITQYLNANKVPTPGLHYYKIGVLADEKYAVNTVWQNTFICQLLVNEVYIGSQVQGKYDRHGKTYKIKPKSEWIIHKNTHTAIVDKVQFEAVQQLVAEARTKYKKQGNKLDDNIFIGKVFCTRCGRAAKRKHSQNKSGVNFYYHCRYCSDELRYTMELKKIKHIPMVQMETAVTEIIQSQIKVCLDYDDKLEKASRSVAIIHKRHNLTLERDNFIKASKRAEDLLEAAYTHHLNGLLDSNEFKLARAKFENDKQTATVSLAYIEQKLSEYELDEVRKNEGLTNFRAFKDFKKLDKTIIDTLVYRIDITPLSNEIVVTLNFKNSLEKLEKLIMESEVITNVH